MVFRKANRSLTVAALIGVAILAVRDASIRAATVRERFSRL
jgi:hypothetical protein